MWLFSELPAFPLRFYPAAMRIYPTTLRFYPARTRNRSGALCGATYPIRITPRRKKTNRTP